MDLNERVTPWVDFTGQQVVDDDHPMKVKAISGSEHLVFAVHGRREDMGLSIGVPCRQGTDPHGTQPVAAVSGVEKPLQSAVTRRLDADPSATAGEGEEHA